MEVILTPSQMRAYDSHAIRTLSIPGPLLMENAGAAVARAIVNQYGSLAGRDVVVIAGKGNNGGDGFVIARHLIDSGAKISVLSVASKSALSGDARLNFKILSVLSRVTPNLRILSGAASLPKLPTPAVIIDAIFGTGFSGSATGPARKAIDWINNSGAQVVSVDIPSGLESETGLVSGVAVKANLTVTMAFRKTGMLLNAGPDHCGKVVVVPIGATNSIPKTIKPDMFAVDGNFVSTVIPERTGRMHKYSLLKTVVIAGSRGMTGAPLMTCRAALRVGGGLVRLCTPASCAGVISNALPESMITPLPETERGTLSVDALAQMREVIDWADIVVIGPGLSKDPSTQELARTLLTQLDKPIVLDADGLNAVTLPFLKKLKRKSALIITPHVAEASRLTGMSSTEIEQSRGSFAAVSVKTSKVIFVLKGAPTVTGSPEGKSFINTTGNPNLATPGSGDILTGVIAGLLAQGIAPLDAALSGVFLHGLAADRLRDSMGDRGLLATDLVDEIPHALNQIRTSRGN